MPKRLPHLDGLRAIAVLSVVAEHAASYVLDPHSVPGNILRAGMHGVDLFFVISGFCLSYPVIVSLYEKGRAEFDVSLFAARRLLRIIPPYYAAIALLVVFLSARRIHISWPDVANQMFFLDWAGAAHMLNPSFWTLPIEFRWYFLFPIMLMLWTRSRRAFALTAIAAMLSTATRFWSQDILILPAFMLGIVAAHVFVFGHKWLRMALPASICLAVLGTFCTPMSWDNCIHPAWQAAAFCFVVSAGAVPWLNKLVSNRLMTCIGTASYSIYLIHDPLLDFLARHGQNIILASGLSVGAGIVLWALVERPLVQSTVIRRRLLAEISDFIPKWLEIVGIKRTLWLIASDQGCLTETYSGRSTAFEDNIGI